HNDRGYYPRRLIRIASVEHAEFKGKIDQFLNDETRANSGKVVVNVLLRANASHHPSPLTDIGFENDGQSKFKFAYSRKYVSPRRGRRHKCRSRSNGRRDATEDFKL